MLYVAPYPPSETRVRPYLLLGALSRKHHIDIVTLGDRNVTIEDPQGRILATRARTMFDRFRSLRHLLDRTVPLQAIVCSSQGMNEAVRLALDSRPYDLVHVEHLRALQFVPPGFHDHVLFDAVDCVSHLFQQASPYQDPAGQLIFTHETGRLARYETAMLTIYNRVVVASPRDANILQERHPRAQITVIPNPVDLKRFQPLDRRHTKRVVMTGRMSFHANHVAARWLCRDIWPQVRCRHADATLIIAGARPRRGLKRQRGNGVQVIGYVADLGAVIGSAAVAVAPLRYAVGIQNKLLEAMACATPVVATRAAVGDLPLVHGQHLLIADESDEFAAAVNRLLEEGALAQEIGLQGRDFVRRNHAIEPIADLLYHQYFATAGQARSQRVPIER